MTHHDILLTIEQMLQDASQEYAQIVNAFENSVKDTDFIIAEKRDSIRMQALEARCKNSQFLLEKIITSLKDLAQIKKYENQVAQLLNDIRDELHKNNLLEMIKHLERIPVVMSAIDNDIKTQIQKTSTTLH